MVVIKFLIKKFNFLIFGKGYFTNFTVIFLERYRIWWSHSIPIKFIKSDNKGKGIKYKILLIKKIINSNMTKIGI